MIIVNGNKFETIAEPIYVNGKRISQVWVNGLQVYPGVERKKVNRYAMYLKFSSDIVSKYSSTPVNEYGCYALFAGGMENVHRVAFGFYKSGDYPSRQLFVSYEGFVAGDGVTYVPYVAKNGYIVEDGLSHASINTYACSQRSSGRKIYYDSGSHGMNLYDADGNYLTDYSSYTTSENVGIFTSASEAINFVLS